MKPILGLDSRVAYTLLVAAFAVARLGELRLARRNRAALLARGGVEAAPGHYRVMVLLHATFLAACPLEVWSLGRPFRPALAVPMLVLLGLAVGLRYWAIATLGPRWTTRIICLPGVAPVVGGPYRLLRHPNYLAVAIEIAALPLVHGAWWSAALFSLANALLLAVRIRAEERALARLSDYETAFAGRPRLFPRR
ncbi:MAG TPA: isoprenylcysteine carboxylmethyltransferase family protein [Thermoanaerobaculia bacterium]|nr:isoprenylcysteine carboxylmethyltransferase family protein [Thermoanaerobaculia bacterium]